MLNLTSFKDLPEPIKFPLLSYYNFCVEGKIKETKLFIIYGSNCLYNEDNELKLGIVKNFGFKAPHFNSYPFDKEAFTWNYYLDEIDKSYDLTIIYMQFEYFQDHINEEIILKYDGEHMPDYIFDMFRCYKPNHGRYEKLVEELRTCYFGKPLYIIDFYDQEMIKEYNTIKLLG